ncbi:MAG: hypothetical protein QM589_04725 [Thermomicrobiales bacterium]
MSTPVLAAIAFEQMGKGVVGVVTARESGIYASVDAGQSWQPLWEDGLAAAVVRLEWMNQPVCLVGLSGAILRSETDGVTWDLCPLVQPAPLVLAFAVCSGSEPVVLAGTHEDGVFRSTDGGRRWESANVGLYLRRITALKAVDSEQVVVAAEFGVFRTQNGGESWTEVTWIVSEGTISAVAAGETLLVVGTTAGRVIAYDLDVRAMMVQVNLPDQGELLDLEILESDSEYEILAITENAIYHVGWSLGEDVELRCLRVFPIQATCGGFQRLGGCLYAVAGHDDGSASVTSDLN